MSQYDFGDIDPYVVDGVQLAGDLNRWRDALYAKHRGAARPSYAMPGLDWLSDAADADSWVWNFYSGATKGDLALYSIDTVAGQVVLGVGMQAEPAPPAENSPAVATCEFVQAAIQAALQSVQGLAFSTGSLVDVAGALSSAPAGWVMAIGRSRRATRARRNPSAICARPALLPSVSSWGFRPPPKADPREPAAVSGDRPPFDAQRAAFWLIAFVIGVHAVVVLASAAACLVYAEPIILRPELKCDADARLFQLLSAALAAALAFAGIRK